MTVAELIGILKKFDPDMEIVIGMQQRYGTDFVYVNKVDIWDTCGSVYDDDEYPKCVVINEGRQIGSVFYDRNFNDENY